MTLTELEYINIIIDIIESTAMLRRALKSTSEIVKFLIATVKLLTVTVISLTVTINCLTVTVKILTDIVKTPSCRFCRLNLSVRSIYFNMCTCKQCKMRFFVSIFPCTNEFCPGIA